MFGVQRLRDEIEGLQEERNYFRSKYLEQVSEIASLKDALKQSEREVSRLRREVMALSPEMTRKSRVNSLLAEEKKEDHECVTEVISSLSLDDEQSSDEDEDEQVAIRQKAEQLVRWASYRQEVLSPDRSLASLQPEADHVRTKHDDDNDDNDPEEEEDEE